MKILFTFLLLTITAITLHAQQTVSWIGGTPGLENNWNEARNWSNYKVPDAFSNVLIPDVSSTTFSAPVIVAGIIELNSLMIESNARLQVATCATLIIYEQATGLENSALQLNGAVIVINAIDNLVNDVVVLSPLKVKQN